MRRSVFEERVEQAARRERGEEEDAGERRAEEHLAERALDERALHAALREEPKHRVVPRVRRRPKVAQPDEAANGGARPVAAAIGRVERLRGRVAEPEDRARRHRLGEDRARRQCRAVRGRKAADGKTAAEAHHGGARRCRAARGGAGDNSNERQRTEVLHGLCVRA